MTIRNATLQDLPAIVSIYNSSIPARLATADTEAVTVQSRVKWLKAHNPQTRPLWVWESENEITAWLSLNDFYGRPAYRHTVEVSVYVHPLHHGKGLGRKMVTAALERAGEFDIHTFLGFIFSHNAPSIGLFKQLGFETWGEMPNIAVLDDLEHSLTILGKRV